MIRNNCKGLIALPKAQETIAADTKKQAPDHLWKPEDSPRWADALCS